MYQISNTSDVSESVFSMRDWDGNNKGEFITFVPKGEGESLRNVRYVRRSYAAVPLHSRKKKENQPIHLTGFV